MAWLKNFKIFQTIKRSLEIFFITIVLLSQFSNLNFLYTRLFPKFNYFSFIFYNFSTQASPSGTFFYHSHIGGQRIDGLFGALIVKRRPGNVRKELDVTKDNFIMHVGDWFHERASLVSLLLRSF